MSLSALAQRTRGAIGLRGRIVAVVLITTVATLAIAALLLLGPLESSLKKADEATLRKAIPASTIDKFKRLPLGYIIGTPARKNHKRAVASAARSPAGAVVARVRRVGGQASPLPPPSWSDVRHALFKDLQGVGTRVGGSAVVLGSPGLGGQGSQPLPTDARPGAAASGTPLSGDDYSDVAQAYRSGRKVYSSASIDGTEYARAAIPFTNRNNANHVPVRYVLAVRKSISEIPDAVRVITRAFLEAAAAGLVLTLILGIGLSGRLVARLRRLRRAAIEVREDGLGSVVPVDRTRDEVGDLARSLAAMQERLRQQEEARRAFVATASHELRTPLTSLDGMLELLHDDLEYSDPDIADARDLLARARAQSRRLGRLAADLLDLSRMDAQVQLRSEPVELSEISRAVLAEFELGADERGIRTSLELRGESAWALGDPGSIARILRILVDNAIRISPRGSEIWVRLRRGKAVTLSVCDGGPGVREEERDAIFQRFKRGRDTGGQAGFGLGLAIGRELARRMDGDLVVEPAGAIGATFTLTLPVAHAVDRDQGVPPVGAAGR
jgi:signal transduction histidine kinase